MKVYYDGSLAKDEQGEEWITLAGIAGTDEVWAEFDKQWSKMLLSRYPVAPYIHMIELLDGEDPFERAVGWNEDNIRQLVQDAVVLLSHMNKAGFRMARVSIPETTRQRLAGRGVNVPEDPYLHCAVDCAFMTVGIYALNADDDTQESTYVFFDRGEKFLGGFKSNYLCNRTPPGRAKNPENWWDSFADVQDVDLAYHFGLQAADMIAWAHSRALGGKNRPFGWLEEWLEMVVPSFRMEYTEQMLCKPTDYRRGWERVFKR
ncbi:MAG TPA: DUF3800 domain-containing protein [Acidobacteriaceae bacterium]|nr:DUF3800 domain-containing protein [Acidobacteriaceae bacterium]